MHELIIASISGYPGVVSVVSSFHIDVFALYVL